MRANALTENRAPPPRRISGGRGQMEVAPMIQRTIYTITLFLALAIPATGRATHAATASDFTIDNPPLAGSTARAAGPGFQVGWRRTVGGPLAEPVGLARSPDGSLFVLATTYRAGRSRTILTKVTPAGLVRWRHALRLVGGAIAADGRAVYMLGAHYPKGEVKGSYLSLVALNLEGKPMWIGALDANERSPLTSPSEASL